MKILYTHLYDSAFGMGGAEKVVLDIMAYIQKHYHEEIICCVNDGHMAELLAKQNIRFHEIYYQKSCTFQTIQALDSVIREFNPDLIHSHHRYTTFLLDTFFKKKAPVFHTEHVLRTDKRLFFRYGHLASGVSRSVSENLIDFYHVPKERVITISNGVVKNTPDPILTESVAKQYFRNQDQIHALVIGRLEEQKGHCYLIDAVALLPEQIRSKLVIFLAGDGTLEESVKKQVAERGVEKHFVFLGHTEKVPEFLGLVDFVILPSLWEGLPLSVLEAFSAQKMVLATRIPGTTEVMIDGENGYLAEVRDPESLAQGLIRVIENPDKMRQLGNRAFRHWEESYAFVKTMEQYHQVYQRLARGEFNH